MFHGGIFLPNQVGRISPVLAIREAFSSFSYLFLSWTQLLSGNTDKGSK
jgi:hypothetical protein